ncbi:MAG: hypothetical protein ACM31C_31895 [Acidobacteriota bacterium]
MSRGFTLAACLLSACISPAFNHCPNVDCPEGEVCDGFGGCAVPEQLTQCASQTDGTPCSYATLQHVHVDGACDTGVCRSLELPACLYDGFVNDRIDTAMWDLWLPANEPVVVGEGNGSMSIQLAPGVGRVYNGIESRGRYDMVTGNTMVDVAPASQVVGVETLFSVDIDATTGYAMSAYAGRLHMIVHTSGGVTSSTAIDYDPMAHRYWRIRHDAGGTMELETSPDGAAWTSQRSTALPRLPTGVTVSLLAGTYIDQGVSDPGAANFYNLKLTSATCP